MCCEEKKTSYVLFGTGDYYRRFRHWFSDKTVLAVLDNDKKKQGTMLDGFPVLPPDKIKELSFDAVVILSFYVTEMKGQLMDLGVGEDKIYHFYDLHELFGAEEQNCVSILLLSHDLSLGGPALALYHAALVLREHGYDVTFASMLDGALREKLEDSMIPVMIDRRLQIHTMRELPWTETYDLIFCNTINYHTFLSDRNTDIPVIWWLHDSAFFYEGIRKEKLAAISGRNLKYVSVGPVPGKAMARYRPDVVIEDLIYGVSEGI
ncbi:MAG TPA: hypothetical protein DD414_11975 [Lachnospiraceae bacterium]|nr:hypothetical protein [Lachnospiraceae bacterium]